MKLYSVTMGRMKMRNLLFAKRVTLTKLVFAIASSTATATEALYWTPWVSEENGGPPSICKTWNEAAVGFGASGSYSDNIRLLCRTLPYGISLKPSTDYWSNFFSEEDDGIGSVVYPLCMTGHFCRSFSIDENLHFCNGGRGLVSGIRCNGRYCDNISLECTLPYYPNGTDVWFSNCSWTSLYSEEEGSVNFGSNRYITAVECHGSYCDNMSFNVCSLLPIPPQ
jgi:hypothetical protein